MLALESTMNKFLRGNAASSLQKTYDEAHMICSTAIYFEGQHDEDEALRSWRRALDRITHLTTSHRLPSHYTPKNASERNLYDSLRRLEAQCHERIDILESLRRARQDAEASYRAASAASAAHYAATTPTTPTTTTARGGMPHPREPEQAVAGGPPRLTTSRGETHSSSR
ncbi:hypothetical protein KEM52_004239, partial [Ascosphaera acerosa]